MKTSTQSLANRRAAATLTLLLLAVGCTSSSRQTRGPVPPGPPPSGAVSSSQVRQPAEISSLELKPEGAMASLELVADRPLVWTSFRDAQGDLVIELPNSVPGAGLADLVRGQGLVASVDVELLEDADRPLTRLVVRTREASEHSLAGEDTMLRIELLPVEGAEAVALAYEPVPVEEPVADDQPPAMAPPAEVAQPRRAAAGPQMHGTAEEPLRGPAPTGVAASQLYSVDVRGSGDDVVIEVAGDGQFDYSTFLLENPARFVIDLTGVVNNSPMSVVPVSSGAVEQIRVGQFKPRPTPVSRVVFDLSRNAAPAIDRSADGLTVSFPAFGSGAVASPTTTLAEDVGMGEDAETVADMAEDTAVAEDMGTGLSEPVEEETIVAVEPEVYEEPMDEELQAPPAATSEPAAEESFEPVYAAVEEPAPEEPAVQEPAAPMFEPEPDEAELAAAEPEPAAPMFEPPAEPVAVPEATVAATQPPPVPVFEPPPRPAPPRPAPPRPAPRNVSTFEAQQGTVEIDPLTETVDPVLDSFGALVVSHQERQYVGEPIDMSLRQADLVETLRSFASISDLNFVIQPGISGSVTVELKGVPWDQAMEQILKINNLGLDIDGTIVRIAPMAQLRAEADEQRRLQQARQQAVPLRTGLKSLSYSTADQVAQLLRNRTGSIMSNRGTVQVDARTNTLIIRDLPENINTVLAVIDNLDGPPPQVTIEARIIEATKSFSRSLGIEWGYSGAADQAHGNTTGLQFPNNIATDGRVPLLTGGATGFINMQLGSILDTFILDARLQVAENEGLVNLVSAPRVTTLNNTSASIQSGVQIPIQTVSNRTVSVQFVNATLSLQVTPQVTAEGTIMMDINVAKRSPAPGLAIVGATNSPIQTREARTKVIVRDGGTTVIGGIYEVSVNDTQDRVPGLANIPIIGHLFKNRNKSNSNDELMIFITPRIVQM